MFLIKFAGDIALKEIDLKILDNFFNDRFNKTKSVAALYYLTLKQHSTKL